MRSDGSFEHSTITMQRTSLDNTVNAGLDAVTSVWFRPARYASVIVPRLTDPTCADRLVRATRLAVLILGLAAYAVPLAIYAGFSAKIVQGKPLYSMLLCGLLLLPGIVLVTLGAGLVLARRLNPGGGRHPER